MKQFSRGRFALRSFFLGLGAASLANQGAAASTPPDVVAQAAPRGPARQFIKRPAAQRSGYSEAVITQGNGKIVWLAGHSFSVDANGKSLAGDFDAQFHATFDQIAKTLAEAGGKLSDMVTMTVFLTDVRNHRRFTELRRELLGDNFPASASITITALAGPNNLLEVQGVAVIQ